MRLACDYRGSKYPDRLPASLIFLRGSCGGGGRDLDVAIQKAGAEMVRSAKAAQVGAGKGGEAATVSVSTVIGMLFGGGGNSGAPARRGLRVACSIMTLQQLSGINAVNMFAAKILGDAGLGATLPCSLTSCRSHPLAAVSLLMAVPPSSLTAFRCFFAPVSLLMAVYSLSFAAVSLPMAVYSLSFVAVSLLMAAFWLIFADVLGHR